MKSIANSCCCTLAALAALFGMAAAPHATSASDFAAKMTTDRTLIRL